ncbi:PilZ domain-containing protein [Vibrio porteresiae]|uniref:PilZ domain-containing protein n=1 Tax=Vibrio porteresiae DSM 19223 TaxID=1123496 RepID=A0ABZ0Q9P3_9VIBR|nr:PilZ domain-containing protein [Vibrio porteresiae]WPC73153.1 PilZ domain-containing protein [Vibrio porteresiae DSM 19223]
MTDQEFFSVHHALTINVQPLEDSFVLPSTEEFAREIPAPFIVASEFSQLDLLTDQAKSEMKSNDFRHVCQLLDTQNAKLNLILSFLLSQEDSQAHRYRSYSFGASQFAYYAPTEMSVGTKVRAKLFMEHPAAAIYCYGSVISCDTQDTEHLVTVRYDLLRDVDQDLLIKAALYQQQKLLRQRSLDREK